MIAQWLTPPPRLSPSLSPPHFQGGYNLTSISKSMAMCTSVLLGDPPPALITPLPPPHPSAVATINEVIRHHAPYWRSLRIHSECGVLVLVSCPPVPQLKLRPVLQSQSPSGPPCLPQSIVGNVVPEGKAEGRSRATRTSPRRPRQDSWTPRWLRVYFYLLMNEAEAEK